VSRTLAGFYWEGLASRETLRRREALIASAPYLLERELINDVHCISTESTRKRHHSRLRWESVCSVPPTGSSLRVMTIAATTDTVMTLLAAIVPAHRRMGGHRRGQFVAFARRTRRTESGPNSEGS
jgi:hypothetical protein